MGSLPLVVALAAKDPALAALGLPFLVVLIVSLVLDGAATEADIACELSLEEETVKVGESLRLTATLEASRRVARCRVELGRKSEARAPDGSESGSDRVGAEALSLLRPPRWLCSLGPDEPTELTLEIGLSRPGEVTLGPLRLLISGAAGLYRRELVLGGTISGRARPFEETVSSLPRSSRVRVASGDRLARRMGEGIELAEVRPERPGERTLRINWRATARRGTPHVTVRHPEQSTDVVLFVDTFEEAAIPRVVEVAAAAAAGYLKRRDRVGLVCFGGVLDWVEAGSGGRQLQLIRLRLAAARPFFSYAWKTIERIPSRAVPPGALVVAVSPLRDERATAGIAQLRARGHEVVVVEVSLPKIPPVTGDVSDEAGDLLERMEQEDLRRRLWERGIAVSPLGPGEPVAGVLAGLERTRRLMRPVRP